jgi:hypothetical protein
LGFWQANYKTGHIDLVQVICYFLLSSTTRVYLSLKLLARVCFLLQ